MSNYAYEAVDASGARSHGLMEVADQSTALRRIREMGLFPMKVQPTTATRPQKVTRKPRQLPRWMTEGKVKPAQLAAFTRQLTTLVDVGMPLLRGLKLLQEQEENRTLKRIIGEVAQRVETGGALSEALAAHPKVFTPLYVNMVKAGEAGGVLELVLRRQAEFMEKAQKIKGKVKSAMFYPAAVMFVAGGVMTLLMVFIIPRFKEVFEGLLGNVPLPAFTLAVLKVSDVFKSHFLMLAMVIAALVVTFKLTVRTQFGRRWFDHFKLVVPGVGKLVRKVALARFARTLGTLLSSGVPVLQTLQIVKNTSGNVIVSDMVGKIHDNVKQGGTMTDPLKAAGVFPAIVAGMVDVGEQTGALPEMLLRIADNSDEEVDNAVTSMTSLLEPVMIVFLAVIVGSIVIAMFLPLIIIIDKGFGDTGANGG
ncbi:MAG TPA: type II secretion system F family protein [Candidatus Acidoferrales bacterium]|jgi:type IV pilus assembly protein PilC|nr:type II secretion system F family protein [Candidatus Acidoferrales bacterium]